MTDVHITGLDGEQLEEVIEELDATPNDNLRELAEQWREDQQRREENPNAHPIRAQVLGRCAGELERLIGDTSQD